MYIHFLCKGIFWRKYYFLPHYYTHSIDPKEDVERDKRKRFKRAVYLRYGLFVAFFMIKTNIYHSEKCLKITFTSIAINQTVYYISKNGSPIFIYQVSKF